jgi:hypothetical protein
VHDNLAPSIKILPSLRQLPFTNHNTLSTINTLTITYNHFTSFSSFPITFTTHHDTLDTMAPRKNTKSASTPAPVAASKTAKVPAGRKNTKPASTSAPVAASKTAKIPATRKNIKSASTPAPVADSETAKVYSGRKTRAMIAAEEKAAAEAGNTAVDANIAATQSVKTVKPAATKPAAIKTETAGPAKPAQPVKAAIIKAKTVEPVKLAQPVKANTLKSASNALKALKGAAKTNQDGTNLTTGASTTKPAATKPTTVTPGATKDTIAKPATTTATRATATTATKARTPQATMSMAQAAELIKLFRCFQPSAKTSAVNAHVSKKHGVKKHGVKKPVVKEPVDPAMIPVYSGQPPQAVVDAELTKWLTADKKKPTPWGTQVEPICPENMANDFEAMGFSSDKVKELVVMKEPVKVDGLAQMVNLKTGAGSFVPGTGPEPPKRVRRAAKYHDLILFEDKGESPPIPLHIFTRLHLLTYVTRLGSIRSSQAVPCRARRAALLYQQMGHVRAWQCSRPRHEHEDQVNPLASHARGPPQPGRRLHTLRPKDRRLDPHQEPQQEGLVQHACRRAPSPSSSRSWRQAQRRPCHRLRGTTTRTQRPGGQKDQHQAQGR